MIILKTMQKQDLLVDHRNKLIYAKDRRGNWEPVPIKRWSPVFEMGRPLQVTDQLGVLEGLVPVDVYAYDGPHPGGHIRCSCGALRDEDGECQRCDYGRCHICKAMLNDGLCRDASHNPHQPPPAPRWDKPLPIEEYQSWEENPKEKKKKKK